MQAVDYERRFERICLQKKHYWFALPDVHVKLHSVGMPYVFVPESRCS